MTSRRISLVDDWNVWFTARSDRQRFRTDHSRTACSIAVALALILAEIFFTRSHSFSSSFLGVPSTSCTARCIERSSRWKSRMKLGSPVCVGDITLGVSRESSSSISWTAGPTRDKADVAAACRFALYAGRSVSSCGDIAADEMNVTCFGPGYLSGVRMHCKI
jgi:hypothetical protein